MSLFLTIPKSCLSHFLPLMRVFTHQSLDYNLSSLTNRLYTKPAGSPGSGAGKGGGAGGSIREAGGALGRFGSAQEEAYFHTKQREVLSKLKKQLKENPDLVLKKTEK